MNRQKLFIVAAGAAVVGAAIALLLAPDKGSATRKKLGLRARNLEDYLDEVVAKGKKTWREAKGEVKGNYQDFETYMEHIVKEGKKSWAKMKAELDSKAETAMDDGESYLSRLVHEGKRAWSNLKQTAVDGVQEVGDVVREKAGDLRQTAREDGRKVKNDLQEIS